MTMFFELILLFCLYQQTTTETEKTFRLAESLNASLIILIVMSILSQVSSSLHNVYLFCLEILLQTFFVKNLLSSQTSKSFFRYFRPIMFVRAFWQFFRVLFIFKTENEKLNLVHV